MSEQQKANEHSGHVALFQERTIRRTWHQGTWRNAPEQISKPIREGGGVGDWLWKGHGKSDEATINAGVRAAKGPRSLRYKLSLAQAGQRFELTRESIERAALLKHEAIPLSYYNFGHGKKNTIRNRGGTPRVLAPTTLEADRSVLAKRWNADIYPEITHLATMLPRITGSKRSHLTCDSLSRVDYIEHALGMAEQAQAL